MVPDEVKHEEQTKPKKPPTQVVQVKAAHIIMRVPGKDDPQHIVITPPHSEQEDEPNG